MKKEGFVLTHSFEHVVYHGREYQGNWSYQTCTQEAKCKMDTCAQITFFSFWTLAPGIMPPIFVVDLSVLIIPILDISNWYA